MQPKRVKVTPLDVESFGVDVHAGSRTATGYSACRGHYITLDHTMEPGIRFSVLDERLRVDGGQVEGDMRSNRRKERMVGLATTVPDSVKEHAHVLDHPTYMRVFNLAARMLEFRTAPVCVKRNGALAIYGLVTETWSHELNALLDDAVVRRVLVQVDVKMAWLAIYIFLSTGDK